MVAAWQDKDDETLLEHIQKGSHHAFAMLVERHSGKFYGLAYRYMAQREAAEDIVQAAFLKLWERPHLWKAESGARFTTWFYRLIVNACLDAKKKKVPLPLSEDIEIGDDACSQEEALAIRQQQQQVEAAIQALSERQKTALNLCFYEGLSNKEAAQILQLSVKAVESLLTRAKVGLKQKLMQTDERKRAG